MTDTTSVQAVIFDLDGTLADIEIRRKTLLQEPKNWEKFFSGIEGDLPNPPIVGLFKALAETQRYTMLVVTGRPERYRNVSHNWLISNGLFPSRMFMRKDGDRREDHVIKAEILNEIRSMEFDIAFAVDDRESVVQMWRRNGVTCLQCDEGKF